MVSYEGCINKNRVSLIKELKLFGSKLSGELYVWQPKAKTFRHSEAVGGPNKLVITTRTEIPEEMNNENVSALWRQDIEIACFSFSCQQSKLAIRMLN